MPAELFLQAREFFRIAAWCFIGIAHMGMNIEAPASTAAKLLSTCSEILIGTAGLAAFVGTEPVMAQHKIQGLLCRSDIYKHRFLVTLQVNVEDITTVTRSLGDQGRSAAGIFNGR